MVNYSIHRKETISLYKLYTLLSILSLSISPFLYIPFSPPPSLIVLMYSYNRRGHSSAYLSVNVLYSCALIGFSQVVSIFTRISNSLSANRTVPLVRRAGSRYEPIFTCNEMQFRTLFVLILRYSAA